MTGAGAVAIGGCSAREVVVEVPPKPDPDQVLRSQIAGDIGPLLTAYDGLIAVTTGRRKALLTTLRGQVAAHVLALVGPPLVASAAPTPSTSAASSASSSPPTAAGVGDLIRLEQAAAERGLDQVGRAGPTLARLLASIAACNATHAVRLGQAPS